MKSLLLLILFFLVSSEEESCDGIENESGCLNQKLKSEEEMCCWVKKVDSDSGENQQYCQSTDKSLSTIYGDEKIFSLYREMTIYKLVNYQNYAYQNVNQKYQYNCKDRNFEINTKDSHFTSKEKEILESKEHCLYYHFQSIDEKLSVSDDICQKGLLTEASTKAGYKCGYFDIIFKANDGETENYKTCFLFNKDEIKSGKLNDFFKDILDGYGNDIFSDDYESYSFKLSAGDDISASYDSKEGKIVDNSKKNKSGIIKTFKYYILLLLILF